MNLPVLGFILLLPAIGRLAKLAIATAGQAKREGKDWRVAALPFALIILGAAWLEVWAFAYLVFNYDIVRWPMGLCLVMAILIGYPMELSRRLTAIREREGISYAEDQDEENDSPCSGR
jgi:hypothetical protein